MIQLYNSPERQDYGESKKIRGWEEGRMSGQSIEDFQGSETAVYFDFIQLYLWHWHHQKVWCLEHSSHSMKVG